MTKINMRFYGDEFDALVAIIKDHGGSRALNLAFRLGLRMLADEKTLEEKGKVFTESYISNDHRERILAGESLMSIASGLVKKEKPVKQKKDAQKNENSASENVENKSFSAENTLGNNGTDNTERPNSDYGVFMDESPF